MRIKCSMKPKLVKEEKELMTMKMMDITEIKMDLTELKMPTDDSGLEAPNARRRHVCRREHGWTAELADLRRCAGADRSLRDQHRD